MGSDQPLQGFAGGGEESVPGDGFEIGRAGGDLAAERLGDKVGGAGGRFEIGRGKGEGGPRGSGLGGFPGEHVKCGEDGGGEVVMRMGLVEMGHLGDQFRQWLAAGERSKLAVLAHDLGLVGFEAEVACKDGQ